MSYIEINDRCVGCSACAQICAPGAITMKRDAEGFLYPSVSESLCTDCGACKNICCAMECVSAVSLQQAYYGWHLDDAVRFSSSSGGLFTALAQCILDKDGVVFGAVQDGQDFVYQNTDEADLAGMRKSKYTEIDPGDSYRQVRTYLKQNKWVLFCGTPCRIAGLKKFLMHPYSTLVTVDFVCGGVASPAFLWEDIYALERKYKSNLAHIDFRSKKNGWGGQYMCQLSFENGKKKHILAREDAYFTAFLAKRINRKSCYQCQFVENHFSDITMADFWDYKKIDNLKNDRKGMSMWVVHTQLGSEILQDCGKSLIIKPMDYDIVAGNFRRSGHYEKKRKERDDFCARAQKEGFIAASKSYMKKSEILMFKVKHFIKSILHK